MVQGACSLFLACFRRDGSESPKQIRAAKLEDEEAPYQPGAQGHTNPPFWFGAERDYNMAAELLALMGLQRELGNLQGSWLTRARGTMVTIGRFLHATEVRLYGAVYSNQQDPLPASFSLLLTVLHGIDRGEASGSSCQPVKDPATAGSSPPSAAAAAAVPLAPAAPSACSPSCLVGQEVAPTWSPGPGLEEQLPALLARMLETQAPIISGTDGSATGEPVALIPLCCSTGVVGALWIARRCTASGASGAAWVHVPAPAPCTGAATRAAPPAQGAGVACPFLLSSPHLLQQVGLSASMCLLGGDGAEQLAALCDLVRSLASAGSMQALLGGLCGGVSAHVRQRFLLDPRVVTALVPEPNSSVGLMLSFSGADSAAVASAVAAATAVAAAPPLPSQAATNYARSHTALGTSLQLSVQFSVDSSEDKPAQGNGAEAGLVGRPFEPYRGRVAALLMGREAAAALGGRRMSEHAPRSLQRQASGGGGDGYANSIGGTPRLARHQSVRSNGVACGAGSGVGGVSRIVALGSGSLDAMANSAAARCTTASGGAAAGGGGAAASCAALHVKPFAMAHTLLRHAIRRAAAAAAAVGGAAGAGPGQPAAPESAAGAAAPLQRAVAVEVEDCSAYVQDPRKPARDVLMLLADAAASAAPRDGASPLSAVRGHAPAALYRSAGAAADANRSGGSAAASATTGGRRGVASLFLLALPLGDGRGTLGLYVTFPQHLPRPLLRAVRASLLQLQRQVSPLLHRKVCGELSAELQALCTAQPGSYTVIEAAPPHCAAAASINGMSAELDDSTLTASNLLFGTGIFSSTIANRSPAASAAAAATAAAAVSTSAAAATRRGSDARCIPKDTVESGLSFLLDSRPGCSTTPPTEAGGAGAPAVAAGGGGGGGGGNGSILMCTSPSTRWHAVGDMVNSEGARTCGGDGVGAMSLVLGRASGLYTGFALCPAEEGSRSTVIHVEELDPVRSAMRAQMPLLVASLQSSINSARQEAAVAAVAAADSPRAGRPHGGTPAAAAAAAGLPPRRPTSLLAAAEQCDLAQVELHSQLGHGGCAVVFKGRLGTQDCAIKLMEMPEINDDEEHGEGPEDMSVELDLCTTPLPVPSPAGPAAGTGDVAAAGGNATRITAAAVAAATAAAAAAAATAAATGGDAGALEAAKRQLAARRALLRNAMELAAMTSISHPNIMQVYSTFSNVALERRPMPDGSNHYMLRPADERELELDASPVCVALVCEWCDRGCLATALSRRTFPALLPAGAPRPRMVAAALAAAGGRQHRVMDYRGILMTLLDVAMALRYLHAHKLLHSDLKPANVLLKTSHTDPRGFTAKLADFGFVTLLNQPGDELSCGEPYAWVDEPCGTVTHMAPESWSKPCRLDASADVYSFGIMMWELTAGGVRPYPHADPSHIPRLVRRGVRPTFHETVPVQYRRLAQRCWSAEPACRPRSTELVNAISGLLSGL